MNNVVQNGAGISGAMSRAGGVLARHDAPRLDEGLERRLGAADLEQECEPR